MKLGSSRSLEEMILVLKDPKSFGPDPVYWVFSEVTPEKWANVTITAPGSFDGEYPKTFGHYHSSQINETYHLIEGKGVMVLQKKHFEGDKWIPEMVKEVLLVKAKPGDEITITPEYGHSWSNIGQTPLITYDDWRAGHQPSDYEDIKKLHGMAYYLVEENGEIKAIPNPHYQNLPEPIWLTTEEFKNHIQ
ncbi:MAG: hypothetical protein M1142_00620 [Patescibacteria group bacterium]|nr:hypothetical protein [Patescibacteria group bacterium]